MRLAQEKQHLSWLQPSLSICYWSKPSFQPLEKIGAPPPPPHPPAYQNRLALFKNQIDHLDFCSCSKQKRLWILSTDAKHGAQQYLGLFSWPEQQPVTQIDFVFLWGCVISRGKIMSIVSLMDRECIMGHTIPMNYAWGINSHRSSWLHIIREAKSFCSDCLIMSSPPEWYLQTLLWKHCECFVAKWGGWVVCSV